MKLLKSFLLFLTITVSTSISITSCSKDGTNGTNGINGTNGTNGANGTNGVSNITTTQFTITPTQWVTHATWISVTLSLPSLTDSIKDVVVPCVSKTIGTYAGMWYGLPITNFAATGDIVGYVYGNKQIIITYVSSIAPNQNFLLKIAVIPAAIQKKYPNTNWKNISEVSHLSEVQMALNQ